MFALLRGASPPRNNQASANPVVYEEGRSSVHFHAPESSFVMTHRIPPTTKEHSFSIIQPPFHLHVYQDEFFNVQSGSGRFYKGIDPKPFAILSADGNRKAWIPAGRYHRFENASETEDFVVDVHLTPESYENEQKFFRNFFGYLNDCRLAKVEPSVFQLMVFLYSADTAFALSLPWESNRLSRLFTCILAYWGSWGLGYKTSYDEYYELGKSK